MIWLLKPLLQSLGSLILVVYFYKWFFSIITSHLTTSFIRAIYLIYFVHFRAILDKHYISLNSINIRSFSIRVLCWC